MNDLDKHVVYFRDKLLSLIDRINPGTQPKEFSRNYVRITKIKKDADLLKKDTRDAWVYMFAHLCVCKDPFVNKDAHKLTREYMDAVDRLVGS